MTALFDSLDSYAEYYGYDNADDYLAYIYGSNSDVQSYKAYCNAVIMASSYYSAYSEQLNASYTDVTLREFEGDETYKYNSYSYATHYLSADSFENEDAARAAAEKLATPENNTTQKLNAAIAALEKELDPDKEDFSLATEKEDTLYTNVSSCMQEWIRDSARKQGDITFIAYTTQGSDGNDVLKGYYVVLFQGVNDNQFPLANVRHILVAFEGGTYNSSTSTTTYSDAEKQAAQEKAMEIYDEWLKGEKTEDSFAALAKKYTDDGNGDLGGLYEDIYPGQMVQTFNDWCFAEGRQPGDHGVVITEYGYHIMYYSGDSETNYRDYMVSNDKLSADITAWQTGLIDAASLEIIDTGSVDLAYTISKS